MNNFIDQKTLKAKMTDPELMRKFPEPTKRIQAVREILNGARPAVDAKDFDRIVKAPFDPTKPTTQQPAGNTFTRKRENFEFDPQYDEFALNWWKKNENATAWSMKDQRFITAQEMVKRLERKR